MTKTLETETCPLCTGSKVLFDEADLCPEHRREAVAIRIQIEHEIGDGNDT